MDGQVNMETSYEEIGPDLLGKALTTLRNDMGELMIKTKSLIEESVNEFATSKYGCMIPLILQYSKCLESVRVTSRRGLEEMCKTFRRDETVHLEFETLLDQEQEWNAMLDDVENAINPDDTSQYNLKEGEEAPLDIELLNARTNQEVKLKDYIDGEHYLVVVLLRHFA